MSSSDTDSQVRRYEGRIPVKAFNIGYVLWIPANSSAFNELPINMYKIDSNMKIDPIVMTQYFEETILCFHGWLDNANSFARLAPLLCLKFNMRVISIDLPGHGHSSHSLLAYYDISMFVACILRMLHKKNLHSFHIMAHSLSTAILPYLIAIVEQSKSPKFNVKSGIFIEGFALRGKTYRKSTNKSKLNYLLGTQKTLKTENKILPKLYNSIDELVRSRIYLVESVYPGTQTIHKETARLIIERNVGKLIVVNSNTKKTETKYFLRFDHRLKNIPILSRFFLELNVPLINQTVVREIKCKILVVYGNNGYPGAYLDAVQRIKKFRMSNVKLIQVNGGHHLHSDHPQQFLETITTFLTNEIDRSRKLNSTVNANTGYTSKL